MKRTVLRCNFNFKSISRTYHAQIALRFLYVFQNCPMRFECFHIVVQCLFLVFLSQRPSPCPAASAARGARVSTGISRLPIKSSLGMQSSLADASLVVGELDQSLIAGYMLDNWLLRIYSYLLGNPRERQWSEMNRVK